MNTTITVDIGVKAYMSYHKAHSRPNTIRAFSFTLSRFLDLFSGADITAIPEADVATFLEVVTDGLAQSTKSNRAGHLSAFFNFAKDTFNLDFTNPCSKGIIKKLYKQPRHTPPELLDKEIVDEIIYRAQGRERMMLELMGRTAIRVSEVMSMRPRDLNVDVSTTVACLLSLVRESRKASTSSGDMLANSRLPNWSRKRERTNSQVLTVFFFELAW